MIFVAVVFTVLLVLGLGVMLALRSWGREEARLEALLEAPETHGVSYAVPDGQDPAVLSAALHGAGYLARAHLERGVEVLRVACEESEREQVRRIIEQVDRTGFEGAPMHVAHARFTGEA